LWTASLRAALDGTVRHLAPVAVVEADQRYRLLILSTPGGQDGTMVGYDLRYLWLWARHADGEAGPDLVSSRPAASLQVGAPAPTGVRRRQRLLPIPGGRDVTATTRSRRGSRHGSLELTPAVEPVTASPTRPTGSTSRRRRWSSTRGSVAGRGRRRARLRPWRRGRHHLAAGSMRRHAPDRRGRGRRRPGLRRS
jgi:hypothetical protein